MTAAALPQDARHRPLSSADKLAQDAAEASRIRELSTHPDVIALRTEKVRAQVDGLMWTGLLLGLAFTMVNVQTFAAAGAVVGSLPWCAAWLLDPMVSLVLVAVLRAEQVTARYQVRMRTEGLGPWVARTKLFAFLATYVMNTWHSWQHLDVAGIVLHSVPPVMVYLAAETGPILRDRLTEAVLRAAGDGNRRHGQVVEGETSPTAGLPSSQAGDAMPAASGDATPSGERPPSRPRKTARKSTGKPRRTTREEYLAQAREAHRPGIVVTPAWVREVVPDISRGTSQVVSNLLNAELSTPRITATPVGDKHAADTTNTPDTSAETGSGTETAIEQREAA
ncbi:MAG: hypothetical protein WBA97_32755 [Actinophytocola sp.]|uniref:hypothetical protein n=1 Tax=Actinophytocola sp. TaxID=1872138 RepID=UPI003C77D689